MAGRFGRTDIGATKGKETTLRVARCRARSLLAWPVRAALLVLFLLSGPAVARVSLDETGLPARVLITNDNGIDDPKTQALARAFARAGVETWVVASTSDRSGASNWLEATRRGRFRVREVAIGDGVRAYSLEGTPADCVVFALTGPLADRPPDLIVSGINGGANAGDDWFGSGTIGAVRTGAYFGVPGIAVSGLLSDEPSDHRAVSEWVVELARSDFVRRMRPPQYLTVSLPEIPIAEIRGVEFATRARGLIMASSSLAETTEGVQSGSIRVQPVASPPPEGSDVAALARGNVAIVPMVVDELDTATLLAPGALGELPPWPGPGRVGRSAAAPAGGPD